MNIRDHLDILFVTINFSDNNNNVLFLLPLIGVTILLITATASVA
jgi:hypothetical protein